MDITKSIRQKEGYVTDSDGNESEFENGIEDMRKKDNENSDMKFHNDLF